MMPCVYCIGCRWYRPEERIWCGHFEAHGHSKRDIGEYQYGISMVPCDWVYPYLEALATDERLSGIVEAVEEMMEEESE